MVYTCRYHTRSVVKGLDGWLLKINNFFWILWTGTALLPSIMYQELKLRPIFQLNSAGFAGNPNVQRRFLTKAKCRILVSCVIHQLTPTERSQRECVRSAHHAPARVSHHRFPLFPQTRFTVIKMCSGTWQIHHACVCAVSQTEVTVGSV